MLNLDKWVAKVPIKATLPCKRPKSNGEALGTPHDIKLLATGR